MQFSKGRHWLALVAGPAALFGWDLIMWLCSSHEPMQHAESCRLSSMHRAATQLGAGAVTGWLAAFFLSHLILSRFIRRENGDWRALLSLPAAVPLGIAGVFVLRRIDEGSMDQLIPFLDLFGSAFPGLVIGWCSGLAAVLILALPGEGQGRFALNVFLFGLIAIAYIGAEGMAMGQQSAEYNEWHGRMRHVSEWSVPAAFFAYGLLAGWILPFLARWRLKVPARWFALIGVLGIALLVSTGWMISVWPPGTGRWSEPELMSGFWPPFFNGLFIGLALAGFLLAGLKPRLPSGEVVPESGNLERGG